MMTKIQPKKVPKTAYFCYDKDMKEILKNLGLSPNEIAVYEALTKLGGSSSAGEIIKLADLHRNIVYDCLAHLGNRKLVQVVEKNKKKFFTLKNPEHLIAGFQKQIANTQGLMKVFSSLSSKSGCEVTIHEGGIAWQEAWQSVMRSMKPKSTFYTLGMAGDKWVKLMGESFVEYEQWALKNKIVDRILSQKHLQKEIEAHQSRQFRDIRYMDIELPAHASIEIFEDRCFFELYDEPATIIEIRGKGLARTLRAYFEIMWSTAKK